MEAVAERFIVSNVAGGLGDWLSLTPILRAARDKGLNPLVLAPDSPHTREFATLYQGLAEVQFLVAGDPQLTPTPETNEDTCFSRRILRAHGFVDVSPIPYVEVLPRERQEAEDLLRSYWGRTMWALVAIAPSPGAARSDLPDSHIANYRRWPIELRDRLIERLHSQGLQPVRFGTRAKQAHIYANHEQIEGVLSIPDLSLRQLAACYAVIGRYVGCDTGDHHLAIATGGQSHVYTPPSTWFYPHVKHLYGPEAWAEAGESPREAYTIYPRAMSSITAGPCAVLPTDGSINPLCHEQTR